VGVDVERVHNFTILCQGVLGSWGPKVDVSFGGSEDVHMADLSAAPAALAHDSDSPGIFLASLK
jgi:hypothetical protein